jgi:hypothetical protein
MASTFHNTLYNAIGTSPTTVKTTISNGNTTVIGFSLTNLTSTIITADIQLQDTVNSITAYFLKGVMIPPNQSLRVINGGEKLIIGPSTNVIISSSLTASLDLVMSYVEIV